jgi:hypothetical protein
MKIQKVRWSQVQSPNVIKKYQCLEPVSAIHSVPSQKKNRVDITVVIIVHHQEQLKLPENQRSKKKSDENPKSQTKSSAIPKRD